MSQMRGVKLRKSETYFLYGEGFLDADNEAAGHLFG